MMTIERIRQHKAVAWICLGMLLATAMLTGSAIWRFNSRTNRPAVDTQSVSESIHPSGHLDYAAMIKQARAESDIDAERASKTTDPTLELNYYAAMIKQARVECDIDKMFVLPGATLSNEDLANLRFFPKLKSLALQVDSLDDRSLEHIEKLPQLERLDLRGTGLTDAGLERLAAKKSLTNVSVAGTKVTRAGYDKFCSLRPDVSATIYHSLVTCDPYDE
ncbi:hypothetical protein Psta_0646 [Pirellula staleyi DSM 6068]|uniref:Leucine Rich repeats (2 copies) n=1 Tax=Pirellula staleyi (strain ATCC 27377 / DSM 6068 / ICPB 4128) TaxID=530564 RepID=D2R4I4_PIRSD|nr:hypothetical protein [Pirellula staleyi]ADB15332.1 hypothetical protein Psta_0646 [Pirellula staleyi DSM 6068]